MAYGIKFNIRTNSKGSVLSLENSENTFILTKQAVENALLGNPLIVRYLVHGLNPGVCVLRGPDAFQIARMYHKEMFDGAIMKLLPLAIDQVKASMRAKKSSLQKVQPKKGLYKFNLN